MKKTVLSLVLAASIFAVSPAHAASVLSELTPTETKAAGFTFDVTHKRLPNGDVKFRVVVTETTAKFSSNASTDLSAVEITDHSQSIRPERRLTSIRNGHSIVCTFSVDKSALKNPSFCFVFTNYFEEVMDGKLVPMPGADFVYARLKDFVR